MHPSEFDDSPPRLAPALTPAGHLILARTDDALPVAAEIARRLERSFARGAGHGLLQLAAEEVGAGLPPSLRYWREIGAQYLTALCTRPDLEAQRTTPHVPVPPPEGLDALAAARPPMQGAEYLTGAVLAGLWERLDAAFHAELSESGASLQEFLKRRSPGWNLVGRVHFNLAENRKDEDAPFAFLATYTTRLSLHGKAQHLPLGQALTEYSGASNRERLLSLLLPVQRAAGECAWLKAMVDAGDIFHPLRWTPAEAVQLLTDIRRLEACGVVVRVPGAWKGNRPPRPQVSATLGTQTPAGLGKDALLDFQLEVTLDGERLTAAEIETLLAGSESLALIRGRWVEVNPAKLERMLEEFRRVEEAAAQGGVTFAEATRRLAGAGAGDTAEGAADEESADWSRIVAGPWLAATLAGLRAPEGLARIEPGRELKTVLRPYQQVGVRWLHFLSELKLGACLADDMGLGKTIQVLALLLVLRKQASGTSGPSLLVAPASLLANWTAEIERFAPTLRTLVAHTSTMPAAELKDMDAARIDGVDLVITSYGSLLRLPWLTATAWRLAILDEAQAIKNPGAKQTRLAKQIQAQVRIALTGTPVENRLSDLWSIFDFINPGLLGSGKAFAAFTKRLGERTHDMYAPLRELTRPYVLRRLKTDKAVIADLPDKTEVKAFCHLSARQTALYQQAVKDLKTLLEGTEGLRRKGVILSFLMRFKQICNHPSQWLGDGAWAESDSGKLARLREIAETIAAKQEKALVFTQFREVTEPVAAFLGAVFGRPGLVLHGGTEVKKRSALVRRFQEDESAPFFVVSLKAGGAGLNLTAASHVVHFDRWWNPAVENQATDRAFRIGQKKNVLVHKFVCRGTVEEKIDVLIASKQQLSTDLLEGGAELMLTEMQDDEILKLVALDLRAAAQ